VEYGADPFLTVKEYEVVVRFEDYTSGEPRIEKLLVKSEPILEIAKKNGCADFAEKASSYAAGKTLPDTQALRNLMDSKDYKPLITFLEPVPDARYCKRDRDLLRNAHNRCAAALYAARDYRRAALQYAKALFHAESNENGVTSWQALAKDKPEKWIHEDANDSPCYSLAYGLGRSFSGLKDAGNGFGWLSVALKMNPGLKPEAKADKELQFLRKDKKRFAALVK
jgi:hypothetical protein